MTYESIPTTCEAEQYLYRGQELPGLKYDDDGVAFVTTIQGRHVAVSPGEWIIREPGDHTKYYPCDDATFAKRWRLKV